MKLWDQSDIYALINKYPQQFERGFRAAESIQISKGVKEVIISATSYNAAIAQIIADLFKNELNAPITVHQGYDLPKPVSPDSLVIVISLCGKRPEMLSAAQAAYAQKAKIVAVTTGGELEVFARERNLPLVLIDKALSEFNTPSTGRLAGGFMVAILTQILINAGVLSPKIRQQILAAGEAIEKMYLPKLGQKLAEMASDSTTLIYSSNRYNGLAQLIKSLLNILVQMPCFYNEIPAMLQSEIKGLERKGFAKYFTLILQDNTEDTRMKQTILTTQTQLTTMKIKNYALDLPGQNQLEKTLASIMLIYWMLYWMLYWLLSKASRR